MKYVVIVPFLFVGLLALLGLRPISQPTADNVIIVTGTLDSVYSACTSCYDISFQIAGENVSYYINRGEELGLDIKELASNLTGKEIELHIIKHWTLLVPEYNSRHIAKLQYGEEVLYSEYKEDGWFEERR